MRKCGLKGPREQTYSRRYTQNLIDDGRTICRRTHIFEENKRLAIGKMCGYKKLRCHRVAMRGYQSNARPQGRAMTQENKHRYYMGIEQVKCKIEHHTQWLRRSKSFINARASCVSFSRERMSHHRREKTKTSRDPRFGLSNYGSSHVQVGRSPTVYRETQKASRRSGGGWWVVTSEDFR